MNHTTAIAIAPAINAITSLIPSPPCKVLAVAYKQRCLYSDAQALAVHDGTLALAPVLRTAIVKGDGHGYLVLVLVEHGRGVHAARGDDYRIFHINRCAG